MGQIIIGSISAFLIVYYTIPIIINLAEVKKLYDEPDEVRKLHRKPIPALGGLGIFVGFSVTSLLTINFTAASEFQYYFAAFLIIFFIGLKDDFLMLSATKKLIGQLIAAIILIFSAGLLITDVQGFLGLHNIDNTLSHFLTLFTIVVVVNAFNLIDGVDGLAGSIGFISCSLFGTFFLINGNIPYATLAFAFSASLLAFLIYNHQPAKIFMGDTGSLMLGLVNSILVIKFIGSASHYKAYPISAAPAVGFAIVLLPLMDTLRVFGIRIFKGKSPFSPDRNHLHHLLLDRGLSHRGVAITCSAIAVLFVLAALALQGIGTTWLILGLISTFFIMVFALEFTRTRIKLRVVKRGFETINQKPLMKEEKRIGRISIIWQQVPATAEND